MRSIFYRCLVVSFFMFSISFGEVCKLIYNGNPEDLNDSTVDVPTGIVAMSEVVHVGSPVDIISGTLDTSSPPSVFFVIDHSGSMCYENNGNPANDSLGARFTVSMEIIDTIRSIFPKAEIGVAVFRKYLYYNPVDDTLFATASGQDTGGYIPLLQLDKTYNGETGYNILKKYLDTNTVTDDNGTYVSLKYEPSNLSINGGYTNINAGFDAVKSAFKKSKYPKSKHYVIFLSDGKPTYPSGSAGETFKSGDSVATTFTIFFNPNLTAPAILTEMTTNIQNNGYSSSNPESNIWPINNNHDTLLTILLENVLSVINQKQVSTPNFIKINGIIATGNPVDNNYVFDKLFPMTGFSNNFIYDINYKVLTDSITLDGDTIVIQKDTSTHSEVTITISDTAVLPPKNFETQCWDRKVEFYYNGNKISLADETMDSVEVRFESVEIDTFYNYTDVSLDFTSNIPSDPDLETFKLSDKGSYFVTVLPLKTETVSSKGNSVLEHGALDTIVAIFRNPELPLDTLRAYLPYKISSIVTMDSSACFDNNADGKIDSLFIWFSGLDATKNSKDLGELIKALQLPDTRSFEIIDTSMSDNGISISLVENSSSINTAVTPYDSIKIKPFVMSHGGWVVASSLLPADKVAPVIVSATVIDFQDDTIGDTLFSTMSEAVKILGSAGDQPYYFKDSSMDYSVKLSFIRMDGNVVVWAINSVVDADRINNGDSIWINWHDDCISDTIKDYNIQKNYMNIRSPIFVNRILIPISFIPDVVTPFNLSNLTEENAIPDEILNSIDESNKLDLISNENGKFGMIITVHPDELDKLKDENPKMSGTVSIYDAVANRIKKIIMGYNSEAKSLVAVWNCRNDHQRVVASGAYLAVFEFTVEFGDGGSDSYKKKKLLTVKR